MGCGACCGEGEGVRLHVARVRCRVRCRIRAGVGMGVGGLELVTGGRRRTYGRAYVLLRYAYFQCM